MAVDIGGLNHEQYMREALREAELILRQGERPIAAVIVHDRRFVGRGRAQHRERQSKIAHAELNALLQAEQYLCQHRHECMIHSTVEPCIMCLGATVLSDIDHAVYALPDHWIEPSGMLRIGYVGQHIRTYRGGVLEAGSAASWQQAHPDELRMLREGRT